MRARGISPAILIGCLVSFLHPQNFLGDRYINPAGWTLPDPALLVLKKVDRRAYGGLRNEIISEYRLSEMEPPYYLTNALITPEGRCYSNVRVREEVEHLVTYRTTNGKVLCYLYQRLLMGPTPDSRVEAERSQLSLLLADGGTRSFFFDADGDGIVESMVEAPRTSKSEEALLVSIIKFKLGCL